MDALDTITPAGLEATIIEDLQEWPIIGSEVLFIYIMAHSGLSVKSNGSKDVACLKYFHQSKLSAYMMFCWTSSFTLHVIQDECMNIKTTVLLVRQVFNTIICILPGCIMPGSAKHLPNVTELKARRSTGILKSKINAEALTPSFC